MSPKLKQILSGIMIFTDFVLIAFFIAMALDGEDVGISIFLSFFLLIDALLSFDYIRELGYKIKHNRELEKQNKQIKQQAQAFNRVEEEAYEDEEEDLVDILTRKDQSQTGVRRQ